METEKIRVVYSRNHTTVFPKLGVFLAGPTPQNGEMQNGWRRVLIEKLQNDKRLDPSMVVIAPEPESGNWNDILLKDNSLLSNVYNKQIPWEWQYLELCDITVFWLPTYYTKEKAECFSDNIGPTSRLEFGYYLQEYLKNPTRRKFIVGSPEDAESINWAKSITEMHNIKWHILKKEDKDLLVAASFIEEIVQTLLANKWNH